MRKSRGFVCWWKPLRVAAIAIFNSTLRVFSRAKGESAVAAVAYRAGIALRDERTGQRRDFRKRRGVEEVAVLAPPRAPGWAHELGKLANAMEAAETRGNARVGRELVVALPCELDAVGRRSIAMEIGQAIVGRYGAAVLVALHAPDSRGDERNHHVHLVISTRQLGADGFGAKVRCLDDQKQGPKELVWLRELVANTTNRHLESAGVLARIDHRSLAVRSREAEERGDYDLAAKLARAPQRHLGRAATAALRRGTGSVRQRYNARVKEDNDESLATYLKRVREEPLPAQTASFVPRPHRSRATVERSARATGRDAALLNGQAELAAEDRRASREAIDAYLASLQQELAMNASNPAARATVTLRELADSLHAAKKAREELIRATQAREEAQRVQALHDEQRPSSRLTRWMERWENERAEHMERLRQAVLVEQASQQRWASHASPEARARRMELRRQIREQEVLDIARRVDQGAMQPSPQQPAPGPRFH